MGSSTPPAVPRAWLGPSSNSRTRRADPACCARPGGPARAGRPGGRGGRSISQPSQAPRIRKGAANPDGGRPVPQTSPESSTSHCRCQRSLRAAVRWPAASLNIATATRSAAARGDGPNIAAYAQGHRTHGPASDEQEAPALWRRKALVPAEGLVGKSARVALSPFVGRHG